jgi:hypothetical protein
MAIMVCVGVSPCLFVNTCVWSVSFYCEIMCSTYGVKSSLFSKTRPFPEHFQNFLQKHFVQNELYSTCFRFCGRNRQRCTSTPMVEFDVLRRQNPAGAQRPVTFLRHW